MKKLLSGGFILLIGSNFYNFAQFIFQIVSGRYLEKAAYSDLAATISLFGILGIIQSAASLSIIRYIASEKDQGRVSQFINAINQYSLMIATGLLLILMLIAPWLASFLHITTPYLEWVIGPLIFLFTIVTSWRSILQGLTKFGAYVASLILEAIIKLLIFFPAVVWLHGQVWGALSAVVGSVLLASIVSFWPIRQYFRLRRDVIPDVGTFLHYSGFAFIQGLALTSMYSTDFLLVKHYFSSDQAALYAALAILGRIAFFGITPVGQFMFPTIAKRHADNQPYQNILLTSLAFAGIVTLGLIGLYYFFPVIIISLYGARYMSGAPLLWWFAVTLGLLAMSNLLIQFYLSIGKTMIVALFALSALLQVILIVAFHASLLQVVQMSAVSIALLFVGLLLYFPYHRRI